MVLVTVIPIRRGAFTETLTFFSKEPYEVGMVVHVPIRDTQTPALVIGVADAREEKLAIKEKNFSLKKIKKQSGKHIFPPEIIEAFRDTASYHASPLGAVLGAVAPAPLIASLDKISEPPLVETRHVISTERLVLQAETEERMRLYRNITREVFARNESVILVTSTIVEAERAHQELQRGIEDHVVLLTSALSRRALVLGWNRATSQKEPLLIICTPSFVGIPCPTVNTYLVERESSRSYVSRERPNLDMRLVAEYVAKRRGARIVFADFPLRIETRARLDRGELEEMMRVQVSAQSSTRVRLVDVRKKKQEEEAPPRKKKFSVFADSTEKELRGVLERGEQAFLFTQRTGYAPLTVCNDCGTPIVDATSGTPLTLHKTSAGNVFLSHYSGALVPANISCAECGGWNLTSLGIGVERVIEEAEKLFPDATVIPLTADSAPTHAQAKKIAARFFQTRRAILVGTERALPYLAPLPLSVVVSIDSLLSLTAWRSHAYALHTLFFLRDRTLGSLFLQTRQPDHPIIRAVVTGNPTDVIRHELTEREQFGYPPFTIFIGLTWSGTPLAVATITEKVTAALADTWDVVGPLPARHIGKNRYLARAVLRLPRNDWPNEQLTAILKTLPPAVSIMVDPDEIV